MNNEKKKPNTDSEEDKKFPLPVYDEKDDIYSKAKEENFTEGDETFEADLDVPGAELDDEDENIDEEDEENNYYSLGGDDHNDAEEDNPDVIENESDIDDNNN